MNILYSKQSRKFINKQEKKTQDQITSAINKIPLGDIKPLKGYDSCYRLRVLTFRIIFTIYGEDLKILIVDNRGDIY